MTDTRFVNSTIDNIHKAKYLMYSKKNGEYIYKVPKDKEIVGKAVQDYEEYRNELEAKLVKAFMTENTPQKAAEALAEQVMEEHSI